MTALALGRRASRLAPIISLSIGMLARASGQIVALIVTLFAARHLSPTEFGVYAIAAALITIIRTLHYSATFQYLMQTPELDRFSSECLALNLLTSVVCSVLPLAALLAVPTLFGSTSVLLLFVLMAPSNLIAAFSAWAEAQLLRHGAISRYYLVTAVTEVLSGAVAVILLTMGYGVLSLVPMVYIRAGVLLAAYSWLRRPRLSSRFDGGRFVEIVRWSMPQYASSLTGLFSNYGADFMIGAILSPAATGIYRAASRITAAVSDLSAQPVRITAITVFARRRAAGSQATDLWAKMAALSLFIALPALGGLAAIADLLLPNMFGPAWANLGIIVAILSIGRIFTSVGGVATPFLVAHGRHKTLLPVQLVSAACLLLGLLLFARFGIRTTALVTTIATLIGAIVYVAMAYRTAHSPWRPAARLMALAALPGLISTAAAAAMSRSGFIPHPIGLAAASVAVAILLWLVTVLLFRRELKPLLHPLRESATTAS